MPVSDCLPGCAQPRDRLGSVPLTHHICQERPAMTTSRRDGATARKSPSSDPTAALERPGRRRRQCTDVRQRCRRRCAARARHPLHRAQSRGELPRSARQLVNYLGNATPQMLLCLHEEAAVAIAHGYAKVTGKPMAAAVHSNVGLMHATMAFFNAWCDRMPVIVARRHRSGRCRQAPAVDRLDPHRARPGRAGAQLHQVGRPAGFRPPRSASSILRAGWIAQHHPARPGLRQPRRRAAGSEDR